VTPPAHDAAVAVGGLEAPRLDAPRPAWRETSLAVVLAGVLALGFAAFGPGVDSAAHAYQLEQFTAHGWKLWDNYWYAGRYELVNYSLLFYPLAAVVGQLLLAVISVAGTAGLFSAMVLRQWGRSARYSAWAFAVSWPALIVAAQYPFALGAFLAMAALALAQRHRLWLAVLVAVASLLASPLAFLLLIVILAGLAMAHTRVLRARPLRSVAPVLALSAICGGEMVVFRAFPAGGTFPYPWLDFVGIVLFSVAGLLFAGRHERTRPLAGIFAAYLVLGVTAKLQPSALGGNVARLLDYAAVPLLTLVLAQRQFRPRLLAAVALGTALVWQVAPAYRNASGIALEQAEASTFWQPVFRFFDQHQVLPEYRVEVVATWGHWESYYLAGRGIPIARGWYRQDDYPLNQVLYTPGLTATKYRNWLHNMGVAYVLLPHDELDASARQEAQVLETDYAAAGLRVVEKNAQWTIYAVENPKPIFLPAYDGSPSARADAKVLAYKDTSYVVWAGTPGVYQLATRYNPYWRVDDPSAACVTRGANGFVQLRVIKPGPVKLTFHVSAGTAASAVAGGSSYCLLPPAAPAS
jgi:hypothetical protein